MAVQVVALCQQSVLRLSLLITYRMCVHAMHASTSTCSCPCIVMRPGVVEVAAAVCCCCRCVDSGTLDAIKHMAFSSKACWVPCTCVPQHAVQCTSQILQASAVWVRQEGQYCTAAKSASLHSIPSSSRACCLAAQSDVGGSGITPRLVLSE
jgi:hypothetical protein